MRVALVHSYYNSSTPSGENVAVEEQAAALSESGYDVRIVARRTDEEQKRHLAPLRAAASVASGFGIDPTEELTHFEPDVVHVHNLFPWFGTRWLRRWNGPVVATMHNYRRICANGFLLRDGQHCTVCPDGSPWAGVRYACYRDSRLASFPLAWRNRRGLERDALLARAEKVIALTERSRDNYTRYGLASDRATVLPNFVRPIAASTTSPRPPRGWVFVGRVSTEKGLLHLLKQWPAEEPLTVFGDGDDLEPCRALAVPGVRFRGQVSRETIQRELPEFEGMVVPSLCDEGLPFSLLESLAAGVPCVSYQDNGIADVITKNGVGALLSETASPTETLATLQGIRRSGQSMRAMCLSAATSTYSASAWLRGVTSVYEAAISAYRSST